MKITNITYNNFIEVVKEKINTDLIPQTRHKVKGKSKTHSIQANSINKEELLKEIEKFFKKVAHNNYSVSILFHQKTKMYVIKVIDNETKEVVTEAPLEKILDIISFIEDLAKAKKINHRR